MDKWNISFYSLFEVNTMKKIIKHFMKPVEVFETLDDDIGMFLIISICTALIFTFFSK